MIAESRIIHILHDDYMPTKTSHNFPLPDLLELSRSDIVPQLRAPIPHLGELGCREERNCEGLKVFAQYQWMTANTEKSGPQFPPRTTPFGLKEFWTPEMKKQIDEQLAQGISMMEIRKNIPRQPCFFCAAMITCSLATQMAQNNHEIEEPMVIQPFSMIFGKPGEYAPHASLLCGQNFHGLIAPFLQYSRTNYVPFLHYVDGVDERVLGWAEIDDIIVGPSEATAPRGDPLFKFVPPPGR